MGVIIRDAIPSAAKCQLKFLSLRYLGNKYKKLKYAITAKNPTLIMSVSNASLKPIAGMLATRLTIKSDVQKTT